MIARSSFTAARITGDDVNRFWEKVSKADHPKGCWLWTACGRGTGYGALKIAGCVYDTHRISWMIHRGDIPAGMLVCHTCDNRRCVQPDHLFLGTSQDNVRDMIEKGRRGIIRGAICGAAKLTDERVLQIRELFAAGAFSQRKLAPMFGVNSTTISSIVRGLTWTHVGGPIIQTRPARRDGIDLIVEKIEHRGVRRSAGSRCDARRWFIKG